jgi:AraC family transcriptional activator of pobA
MTSHARILTLAQWNEGGAWRAELPHSCPDHAMIWITRGQGRAMIEGVRRGVGVHNALVIPANTLFSLDFGKQGFGLVCLVPAYGPMLMPDTPQHLRIRDVQAQSELTSTLDAMQREQNSARPFMDEALNAEAALLTVWLRRAMIAHAEEPAKTTASQKLVTAYAALVERDHTTGKTMADYARALGVTPTHLTRTCRDCTGMTAAELLTQRSLHAVRDLLESSDHPFNRVAAMTGFSSAAYFSRFVLHHTGKTPSDLRKTAAERPNIPALAKS